MGKPHPDLFGLSAKYLADACGKDISTTRRWKRGASCPSESDLMIIRRDLGIFAVEWRGWTINGEDLISPDGWCVNRGDALTVPLMHGQISALRAQVRDLKNSSDLEDQPLPSEWDIQIIA